MLRRELTANQQVIFFETTLASLWTMLKLEQGKRKMRKTNLEATAVIWATVLLAWPDYNGKGEETGLRCNPINSQTH